MRNKHVGRGVGVGLTRQQETRSFANAANAPADLAPASATQRELARASQNASDLHSLIERFENRLDPVTFAVPPSASAGGTEAAQVCAPTGLSRSLQQVNDSTDAALSRLHALLERIDL